MIEDRRGDKRRRRYFDFESRYIDSICEKYIIISINNIEEIHHSAIYMGESIGKAIYGLKTKLFQYELNLNN